jgi:DHA1 family bicyclomycin/chloramphenicol resistance-like MFS transporter
MSLTAFSIDISLPLFKVMSDGLNAPLEKLPLTITFYIAMLGTGQLLFGSLSDRYGRRLILIIGMIIFICGAILAALSNSLTSLLIARALQGFGAASPYVLSRAIIRDLYEGPELAKKMAIATGLFSVGPLMAPLIGAMILEIGGNWRWVFVVMAIYCGGMLYVLKRMPETNQSPNKNATQLATIVQNAKAVIQTKQSRIFIGINAIAAVSMILIISTAPSIYANTFGISGTAFALYFAIHGLGIIIGQYANHYLIERINVVPTTMVAAAVMIFASLCISAFTIFGFLSVWSVTLSLTVFAFGFLAVVANTTSMVLHSHRHIIGFTAAFMGTITSLFSGFASSVIALFVQHNILLWSLSIAATSTIALALLVNWHKKTT